MKLSPKKTTGLIILIVIGLIAASAFLIYRSLIQTVQIKSNLDGSHSAKLLRHNGIDINFRVQVDGKDVYYSPDFAPVDLDFRERIAWDKTGRSVILEVAGNRLFGYSTQEKRALTDEELQLAEYPAFSEFHFEGKLPN
ncbi:MAG: hypothetical protein QM785_00400 [Pyrinomonadaceae bacterium]